MINVQHVTKSYPVGKSVLPVLKDINLEVARGCYMVLLGASGSGKTTLLNILGTLEKPDSGTIRCAGVEYSKLKGKTAAAFRREKLGFVFQSYHLLPEFSIRENVLIPAMLAGRSACGKRADALLEQVGLADRKKHRPQELSGGEQQRAAIARALILNPDLILADEPTGNLDATTGNEVLNLFTNLCKYENKTLIMITHNEKIAAQADQVRLLEDGCLHF